MSLASGSNNPLDMSQDDPRLASTMSEDWYHGHKVVAMPSSAFGGLTIREVVSSRNNDKQGSEPRRRSHSAGRPASRGGKDLVQEVYNRMGVNYGRASSSRYVTSSTTPTSNHAASDGVVATEEPAMENGHYDNTFSSTPEAATRGNNTSSSSPGVKMSDKFQSRYRTAATRTSNNSSNNNGTGTPDRSGNATARGRPTEARRGREPAPPQPEDDEEHLSEGQKRARSLSRGRKVIGQWPPSRPIAEAADANMPPAIQPSMTDVSAVSAPMVRQPRSPIKKENSGNYNGIDSPKLTRSHSYDGRPQYNGGRRSYNSNNNKSYTRGSPHAVVSPTGEHPINMRVPAAGEGGMLKDEKKEADDASATSLPPPEQTPDKNASPMPSIKDRINVFAGKSPNNSSNNISTPTSAASSPRHRMTTGSAYLRSAPPPPPPMVDIYQPRNQNQQEQPEMMDGYTDEPQDVEDLVAYPTDELSYGPPEPSAIPPSAAAVAAADAAAKYTKPKWGSSSSRGSYKNGTHSPPSSKSGGEDDIHSNEGEVHEEYANNVTPKSRKPFWTERNKVASYAVPATNQYINSISHSKSSSPTASNITEPKNISAAGLSAESIDKMINERVQVQLEAQLRVIEAKMEDRLHTQLEAIMQEQLPVSLGEVSAKVEERTRSQVHDSEARIDERAQKQIRDVEMKMETLLRRWMDQMNHKITSRLDAIEASIKEQMQHPERHEI